MKKKTQKITYIYGVYVNGKKVAEFEHPTIINPKKFTAEIANIAHKRHVTL